MSERPKKLDPIDHREQLKNVAGDTEVVLASTGNQIKTINNVTSTTFFKPVETPAKTENFAKLAIACEVAQGDVSTIQQSLQHTLIVENGS